VRYTVQARQTASISVPETGGTLTNLSSSGSDAYYASTADGAQLGTLLTVGSSVSLSGSVYVYAASRAELELVPSVLVGSNGLTVVAASSGVAATDTALIQAALDAAATAGGGTVRLTSNQTYLTTGLTIDTAVTLDLGGSTIQLANSANASVLSTVNYASLIGTDSTSGPRDFTIRNGYLDGNKSNQTATDKPVLAIYGRRYTLKDVTVRNGKGTGIRSEWSTTSPFQTPNGFESFLVDFTIHSCDGDGLDFSGPHDTFFSTFFVIKCGLATTAVPIRFGDSSGRANGSNAQQFHVYGGNGYNYGLLANTAGMRFSNFVVEGAQVAQAIVQASQVMFDGFHLYTGGVATATALGLQMGDATHTNVNGCTIRGRVENCGGGVMDVTNAGANNDYDLHHFYLSGTAPTKTDLGIVGTPSATGLKLRLRTTDSTAGGGFQPTAATENRQVGPLRTARSVSTDTREILDLRNQAAQQLYRIDWRGRPTVTTGTGAPVPSIAAGAGAGTSPTVALAGNDHAGKITVTTGTTPAAGTLATVTFSGVFGNAPYVVLTPKDAATAALQEYNGTATSAFSVKTVGAPAASTTYTWDYIVIGA
jgi:hypothetical protein